jgi:hypothetical protein
MSFDGPEDFNKKKSRQTKGKEDRFMADQNFFFLNPSLKNNNYNVKFDTSSSETTTTYDLSLSDDSDDSDNDDYFNHLASFNSNIEKNENRSDWKTYIKSSV